MNNITILIQGYAKQLPDGRWDATSAAVLVRSGGKNVIIDPGELPEAFRVALKKEGLQAGDIDYVVCSHSHADHRKNSRLFPKDRVYEPFDLYQKIPDDLVIPLTEIRVVHTPGHVDNHIAFIVETPEGICAIAGDVFWWEDGEERQTDYQSLIEHVDPVAKNQTLLQESRKKLLNLADYVIPGHGKTFKVPRG